MEPPILRLLDRYIVWLIAFLASVETFGQSTQGLIDQRFDHAILWGVLTGLVILGTVSLETVKSRRVP